ncbi:MAG: cytochrome c3 family protein [Desulfobacterales bacterium]|nr:cytochrome c3 family protein [Desulfobacterales bacterium]
MVKKELKLAYVLAIALLVVGVICYMVPAKAPAQPLRMMYQTVAGRVLFNHQIHLGESGYGISCRDCHHHPEDGSDTSGCGACHSLPAEGKTVPDACLACHEPDELEEVTMSKRADAFHAQCVQCHNEYESGPVECSGCHIQ